MTEITFFIGFILFIVAILAVDMFVIDKEAHVVSIKEAGIDEKEFLAKVDELADKAFSDQCTTANPRVPLVEEMKQILIDSYYGNEDKVIVC